MKSLLPLLILSLLLCNGCKYFKKSSSRTIDTITADTTEEDASFTDSEAYYSAEGGLNTDASVVSPEEQPVDSRPSSAGISAGTPVSGRYYMIVGCFKEMNYADKYAAKMRGMGYESEIIAGPDNFSMVSAKSYTSYRESIGDIDNFRNNVTPNAWVYRQR
jgi:hypothetical protein